ncbi:MAG: serine hydrolase [Mycobacterium leprae]
MALESRVEAIAHGFSGTLGVAAVNLTTNERYERLADMSFYPASTIKLPLLYEVFRGAMEGRWSLEQRLTLSTANIVEGSGILQDMTPGLQLPVRDLALLMTVISDNTATNMLVDLCTTDAVNRSMAELGVEGVRMNRKIGLETHIPMGEATPRGMARLMALVASRAVLTPSRCTEMLDILRRQHYKELTNRFIPETDSEDDKPTVQICSKSGWVRGVRNDVALITTPRVQYVLSMFSKDCQDRRFYHDNEASVALARVSQAVYEAWAR